MDQLLSSAAFKFNLRRFNVVVSCPDDAGGRAFGLNVTLWEWQIADGIKVGRCRLTVSKLVLKAPMVSALETII